MPFLKSYWYYWYTGHKLIAVISMILTALVLSLGLLINAHFSVWGILTAVLLDLLGVWLVILYYLAIRAELPSLLLEQADYWVNYQLIVPVIIAFFVGRFVTYIVAKQLMSTSPLSK